MFTQTISREKTFARWRSAARVCLARGLAPEEVAWQFGDEARNLFGQCDSAITSGPSIPLKVSPVFLKLAEAAVCHNDHERFALLYHLLWRHRAEPHVLSNPADAEVHKLSMMEKSVRRVSHKMKAFVRFREVEQPEGARRGFVAWFEPDHFIVERTAPFFARRFADMDWLIATPKGTANFHAGDLQFNPAPAQKPAGDDNWEHLWRTYYASIFNPGRLKISAMRSEMPVKYWKNLPEAALIPELVANAGKNVAAMHARGHTQPSAYAAAARAASIDHEESPMEPLATLDQVRAALAKCQRCPLYCHATQVVPGEGPVDASLLFVGEQPGDQEDRHGRPLVGPAGDVFAQALATTGLRRDQVFITNAVKHFKFEPRGKRRLHKRANASEIQHCRWWLGEEVRLLKPKVIVALGATAAGVLTGNSTGILARRGKLEHISDGTPCLITLHPAAILRAPDAPAQNRMRQDFENDIRHAVKILQNPTL